MLDQNIVSWVLEIKMFEVKSLAILPRRPSLVMVILVVVSSNISRKLQRFQ